jgi:hypothetical protein
MANTINHSIIDRSGIYADKICHKYVIINHSVRMIIDGSGIYADKYVIINHSVWIIIDGSGFMPIKYVIKICYN